MQDRGENGFALMQFATYTYAHFATPCFVTPPFTVKTLASISVIA
jgi:hypothetical protein